MKKQSNSFSPVEKASKAFIILALVIFAGIGIFLLTRTYAAPKNRAASGVTLSITPSSQRLAVNNELVASIWVDTAGQDINTVQANINYSTSIFDTVSIDSSNSAFSIGAQATVTAGKVLIARGTTGSVNGKVLVATVHLTPRSTTRKTTLTFANDSAVYDTATNQDVLVTKSGATYSVR